MKFKKLLSVLLSVCLFTLMLAMPMGVSALGEDVDMDMGFGDEESAAKTYPITDLNGKYKTQGRTSILNNVLMVDYSASGIEFSAVCEGNVSVTFNASSLTEGDEGGC